MTVFAGWVSSVFSKTDSKGIVRNPDSKIFNATLVANCMDLDFIVFAIAFPILIVIQFWKYAKSKDNKIMLLERHYEIDTEKINGIIDQDTYSPIKLEHFIKVVMIRKTYLLYIAKSQFIYIPIDSFESESDREWFENEIIKKIKK